MNDDTLRAIAHTPAFVERAQRHGIDPLMLVVSDVVRAFRVAGAGKACTAIDVHDDGTLAVTFRPVR